MIAIHVPYLSFIAVVIFIFAGIALVIIIVVACRPVTR
jgi:hypothetical protein